MNLQSIGVIILQYMYGLLRVLRQRQRQHKNLPAMLEEQKLSWCHCVVNHANNWDFDDLINLLTTGMLQIRTEERFSADACFMKGCDLGLFDSHSLDLKSVIPIQQTALQGRISNDNGSTTILLGILWDMKESSYYNGNSQTGRCTSKHSSGILESQKQQQFLAVNLAKNSSNRDQIKRRLSEIYFNINSYISIPTARQYGRTYLSAFLDYTKLSDCSTPSIDY